jgi:hypothetical protein
MVMSVFPSWSPDGTQIVSQRASVTGYDLYAMPAPTSLPIAGAASAQRSTLAVTGEATPITSDGNAFDPSWGAETAPPPGATLSVVMAGSGTFISRPAGVACGTDRVETFEPGTRVVLRANPARGQVVVGWEGACTGRSHTCIITLDGSTAATARFQRR